MYALIFFPNGLFLKINSFLDIFGPIKIRHFYDNIIFYSTHHSNKHMIELKQWQN